MEVMHEIYKTLQTLGMEWKKKPGFAGPWDEHGRPVETPAQKQAYAEMSSAARKEKKHKEKQQEEKYALGLFFVETRCRIGDIVVSDGRPTEGRPVADVLIPGRSAWTSNYTESTTKTTWSTSAT